ncbi:hypothetical protein M513_01649 [Trichuris suis]|uniref:Peptidase S1 domain-containing protein n=1 Tax=Trichuris suis TaxID=68888 RepID=A0A085MK00_9BILA|nr:hypothetical protein M513_01649 [Trichuris suis]
MYFDMRKVLLLIICANLLLRVSEAFCGRPFFKPIFSTEGPAGNRISNGIEARTHSHPWQALILIKDPQTIGLCGGSLIHWKHENASDVILTAAHCLIDWVRYHKEKTTWQKMKQFFNRVFKRRQRPPFTNLDYLIVYLGLHDINRPTSVLQRLRASAMAAAEFDVPKKTDDIALIKLEKEVTYNVAIQGVCLPAENEGLPPPESPCLVAGWGRLQMDNIKSPFSIIFGVNARTYIIDGKVNNPFFQQDLMICTGSKVKDTGARKGDSGGPLVCLKDNTFVVYGVVSFSLRKCSDLTDRQAFTKEFCGQPFFKPIFSTEDHAENRISNGIEARKHSHPWQAFVIVNEPGLIVTCGGSLIHWKRENASDFILTAAHCLIDWLRYEKPETAWQKVKHFFSRLFKRYEGVPLVDVNDVIVYLGLHDLRQQSSATKRLEVTAMAAGEFDVSTAARDIALLKLDEEVTYNTAIQGVCLPAENEGLPRPESPCLVAGWGLLHDGKRTSTLQQFQTYITDSKVDIPYFRKDLLICSRSKVKDTGVRKGDSGGPLVCLRNNEFVVYGVVSLRNMKSHMRNLLVAIICSAFLLINYSEEFCGQPIFKPIFSTENLTENRISNGIEARIHSHPWQAFVIVGERGSVATCGGSLIHWKYENASDFVLTAAHCLIDWERYEKTVSQKLKQFFIRLFKRYKGVPLVDVNDVIVYLGLHDLRLLGSAMKRLDVTAMAAGEFDVFTGTGDIALLKLEKEVTYNTAIQGVCLPAENEGLPDPESPCLVAGWGLLHDGKRAPTLQQLQAYITDGRVDIPNFRKDLMICARSKLKETGLRKGDSGGALVCLRNSEFVVYGVVSLRYTPKCSVSADVQAFTKVTQYLSWMKRTMAKLNA